MEPTGVWKVQCHSLQLSLQQHYFQQGKQPLLQCEYRHILPHFNGT